MKKILLTAILATVALGASAFRTDTIKVATTYLATPEDVTVVVPDAADQGGRFPSVYLLNGYDGNHLQWLKTQPDLGALADRYGMIFVLPDGRDSWYWDSPVQPELQMESFITKDLVPYIDSHYPTVAIPAKRAITGFSMGGHGSLWLAARHPELFASAGSMSGGVDIVPFLGRWNIVKVLGDPSTDEVKKIWEDHSVMSLVPAMKEAGTNIIFDCGVDDFFAQVNDNLHQALKDAKVPHDYISRPGGHTHPYWRNALLYHLVYFNEIFKK